MKTKLNLLGLSLVLGLFSLQSCKKDADDLLNTNEDAISNQSNNSHIIVQEPLLWQPATICGFVGHGQGDDNGYVPYEYPNDSNIVVCYGPIDGGTVKTPLDSNIVVCYGPIGTGTSTGTVAIPVDSNIVVCYGPYKGKQSTTTLEKVKLTNP